MKAEFKSVEFAPGKVLSIETGRIAKQADGAVMVRMGDTMVLSTAVSAREAKAGQDFFPLVVDLRESFTAAGKFPGGFMKREGRPSDGETLASRLIDRSLRPLFPEGYYNETQIICQVYSSDGQNEADVLGAFGASAALHISDIPYAGPMAQVKVGRVNGEFVINPTIDELKVSEMDLIVAGTAESVIMIEGELNEITEDVMLEGIKEGHKAIVKLCEFQEELRSEYGVEKREFVAEQANSSLNDLIVEKVGSRMKDIVATGLNKEDYNNQIKDLKNEVLEAIAGIEEFENAEAEASSVLGNMEKN